MDSSSGGTLEQFLRSIQSDEHSTLEFLGNDQVSELICHKLRLTSGKKTNPERTRYRDLWLARDRNLLPIRSLYQDCTVHATLPSSMAYSTDLREIKPGIWCSTRTNQLSFEIAPSGLAVSRVTLRQRCDTLVEEISLEPIVADNLFSELAVQQGTNVRVIDDEHRLLGQFLQPATGKIEISPESLQKMLDEGRQQQDELEQRQVDEIQSYIASIDTSHGRFADSATGRLLNQLEQYNKHPELLFNQAWRSDLWQRTIKSIVELGPDSVPELIAELETTNDDNMLRCLGFMLRALNDPRAIPALIRAIPKTFRDPYGEFSLRSKDPELTKFFKQHEAAWLYQSEDSYRLHRPLREICEALRHITGGQFRGDDFDENFRFGLPSELRRKQAKNHEVAKLWADWWNQHSNEFEVDEKYKHVDVPDPVFVKTPRFGSFFRTMGQNEGLLLSSTAEPRARRVFYDLDNDRAAILPNKWRTADQAESHGEEIVKWAIDEGFDLMGTECVSAETGANVFVIRELGMRAWELKPDRWNNETLKEKLENLIEDSRRVNGLLLHHDPASDRDDPTATAPFLVITAEGTVAIISIGIEVHDDSEKPGTFFSGESDLNPKANAKGRRFSVRYLHEIE